MNEVKNSTAAYGPGHGFEVNGDRSKLTNNTATGAGCDIAPLPMDGILIHVGSSLGEYTHNVANDNCGNGINNEGSTNKINNNVVAGNVQRGIRSHDSDNNQIIGNAAVNNSDGIRLGSGSVDNLVRGNRTYGNWDDGIDVNGTNNTITENISLGNGNHDLEDDNATCDSNIWTSNTFGTSDANGTPSPACIN